MLLSSIGAEPPPNDRPFRKGGAAPVILYAEAKDSRADALSCLFELSDLPTQAIKTKAGQGRTRKGRTMRRGGVLADC